MAQEPGNGNERGAKDPRAESSRRNQDTAGVCFVQTFEQRIQEDVTLTGEIEIKHGLDHEAKDDRNNQHHGVHENRELAGSADEGFDELGRALEALGSEQDDT